MIVDLDKLAIVVANHKYTVSVCQEHCAGLDLWLHCIVAGSKQRFCSKVCLNPCTVHVFVATIGYLTMRG